MKKPIIIILFLLSTSLLFGQEKEFDFYLVKGQYQGYKMDDSKNNELIY